MNALKSYLRRQRPLADKPAAIAYDIWADSYDNQLGNLVLDLDKQLFTELLKDIPLQNKKIADVGCGTGRHWPLLYAAYPNLVLGFDVSAGMLQQLRRKFPAAVTQQVSNDQLEMVPSAFVDCLITTLTIGHMEKLGSAIAAWSRIIKDGGDVIITDFHPAILAAGGKRSFTHRGTTIAVKNYVHSLEEVQGILRLNGLALISKHEEYINESVKHYYTEKNALAVYEQFKGMPVLYGLHLKKHHAVA